MYAGTDPLTRRPIRLRATAKTEIQARIELGKLLEKARDGRSPEAGVTMAKLLDEYAPIAQWDVSTRQTNEGFIRRTLKPAIGHLKIRQVNGEILDKLYARLTRCRDLSCTGHPFTEHRHMPVLNIDPADTRPAWKQVAAGLAEAITSGVLLPGDEMPSMHASMGRMPNDHNPPGGISTRLISPSDVSADQPRLNDYDSFAEAYAAETETNLINGYYERPAMLALAGDVAGRRILDAGCGSGPLLAALRDRGAIVTGFDKSAGMLELARRRLGDDADLQVAELGGPLPFPGGTFDDVTASLVLHYLEDWGPALAELRRVLKPGGRLIASVDHPFVTYLADREAGRKTDYFATYKWAEEWTVGGQTALMSFWHRPLHAMTDAFTAAGFRITVISEPAFAPDTPRELLPANIADRRRFLCFLFFVLHAS